MLQWGEGLAQTVGRGWFSQIVIFLLYMWGEGWRKTSCGGRGLAENHKMEGGVQNSSKNSYIFERSLTEHWKSIVLTCDFPYCYIFVMNVIPKICFKILQINHN